MPQDIKGNMKIPIFDISSCEEVHCFGASNSILFFLLLKICENNTTNIKKKVDAAVIFLNGHKSPSSYSL